MNIDKNGNAVTNNNMEDKDMSESINNVSVNGMNMAELVSQAIEESKYSGLKSFFEDEDGNVKEYVRVGEYFEEGLNYRIVDAAYIIPKDKSKGDFAVVTCDKDMSAFTYLNRSGKDFIRRLRDIAKAQHVSIASILEEVNVQVQVKRSMRKGHEGEAYRTLDDGTFNWFYDYIVTVVK